MSKNENELAHTVIGLAIEVHRILGPGFHKNVYTECLKHEFSESGLKASFDIRVPIAYKDKIIESAHNIDCIVEDRLLLKFETVEQIPEVTVNAIVKILRQGQFKLGLIINFHSPLLKNGIRRINNRTGENEASDSH
jgi:GxxExxY protein